RRLPLVPGSRRLRRRAGVAGRLRPPLGGQRPFVSVSITEATADDVDRVLALWDVAADPGRTILDEQADLRRLLASAGGFLLVAQVDGHPVGTIVAGWDGWRGNLYRLVVAGEHRR